MFALLLAIFLVLSGFCIRYWPGVYGNSWLSLFFVVGLFLYYVAIPLESSVLGYAEIVVGSQVVYLDEQFKITVLVLANLALMGFMTGLTLTASLSRINKKRHAQCCPSTPRSIVIVTIGSALLLLFFFRDQIIASGSYYGNVDVSYSQPMYSFLMMIAVTSASVLVAIEVMRWGRITAVALAIVAICVVWGIYSSNKDPIVIALFSLSICLHIYRYKKIHVILALPAVLLLASLGTITFSAYRTGVIDSKVDLISIVSENAGKGIIKRLDPAGPLVSLHHAVETRDRTYGATYLQSLYNWIPRAIWPDRPLDISEESARKLIPNWQRGFGMGYSPLAEGYTNYGILGGFVQYFLYGLIWGLSILLISTLRRKKSILLWSAVHWTFGAYMLFVMHRGPFSFFSKSLIHVFVPVLIAWFLFDVLNWRRLLVTKRRKSMYA